MTEPFLGEIRLFAGNFAPRGNATCSGQIMSIAQNTALFSLLGTYYGGNGTTTFALPDLRGRMPVCMGQGAGLSNYNIGQQVGTESVTLNANQMPMHTHTPRATSQPATSPTPGGMIPSMMPAPWTSYWVQDANKTGNPIAMAANAVAPVGGSQAHENRMPILAISIIVALQGIFPSRN
jgi:microcystin-dependent protein